MNAWLVFAVEHDQRWLAALAIARARPRLSIRDVATSGACAICTGPMVGRRSHALHCSGACEAEARRRLQRGSPPRRRWKRCIECSVEMFVPPTRQYCADPCRRAGEYRAAEARRAG